jgi:hypothetical protein
VDAFHGPEPARPVARYPVDDGETVTEAVVAAFDLVAARPDDGTVLYDHVDADALEALVADAGDETAVRTELWGHEVVVTGETVTVYER